MESTKILVVDDEVELERLIKQRFRKKINSKELDFVFASNGVEALQKLQEDRQIDVVLTDINMPQMDGLTLIDRLSKVNETLKAVVISAYGDMPNIRQAMNLGAFDFLTKPINFQELEKTIEKTYTCVQRNRTKQLEAQRAQDELLQEERLKLKAQCKNLSLFLPHEINTSLHSILGFTDFFLEYHPTISEEEALEIIQNIHLSATYLEKVCQKFLLHAKLELLQTTPEKVELLKQEFTDSAQPCIECYTRKKATEYSRIEDLQLDLEEASLQISETFFKTILEELLDNAFRFSQAGTPVLVKSSRVGQKFKIAVSDRGRGMTTQQITDLAAYTQFDRAQYEQQGVGLGLTIVKRILEVHGGTFEINSIKDQATTVIAQLPIAYFQ